MKFACILSGLLTRCLFMVPPDPEQQFGQPAPPLDAKLLDATSFSLAPETGKVVIVNLGATGCQPCRAEMPALNSYFLKHRAEGIVVLGISIDSGRKAVQKVISGVGYSVALGSDASFTGYGLISRVPRLVFTAYLKPLTLPFLRNGVCR